MREFIIGLLIGCGFLAIMIGGFEISDMRGRFSELKNRVSGLEDLVSRYGVELPSCQDRILNHTSGPCRDTGAPYTGVGPYHEDTGPASP
jgi:hypothetical protein